MKHSNNMREKVTRLDNAEAVAKKAAEERRGSAHLDGNPDRIQIGSGAAHPGTGGSRMVGLAERMAPYDGTKATNGDEPEAAVGQKKKVRNKSTWIKGSSESKKMGGNHNVKEKL